MKTTYIPCYSKKDALPAVKGALGILRNFKKIGLITTAQHLNQLNNIKIFLEKNGIVAVTCGQILGCFQKFSGSKEKEIDAFLYIGSGRFHPLGVALKTNKRVIVCNPYSNESGEISDDEKRQWEKRRKKRIMRAAPAEIFGILISTKPGQFNMELALSLKKKIEKSGKRAFLFAGDSITPDNVSGFGVDAYINTACPRIVDDYFDKPVVNPEEIEILI